MRICVVVAVDVIGELRRRPGSVSQTCGSSRCGAARDAAANFDENSPITKCVLCRSIEAEHGRIPEQRRAAVAEQHLVSVGKRKQFRQPVADPVHHRTHAVLAMARAEKTARGVGECGDRLVANLRRTGAEAPVGRSELGGDLDHGNVAGRVLTESR